MYRVFARTRTRLLVAIVVGSIMSVSVATVARAAPSAPSDLRAVAGDRIVTLEWGSAESLLGVASYNIYRGGVTIASVDGDSTNYADEAVVNGVCYSYWVTATDALGEGPPSNTAEACPEPPEGAPSAPQGLRAHAQEFEGYSTVTLTWKPPAEEGSSSLVEYRVYEQTDLVGVVPANKRQFRAVHEHTGTGGTTYQVTAVNDAGEGPPAWVHVSTGPCEYAC